MCDALSASGLAGALNAPLLLTTSGTLSNPTRHALNEMRSAYAMGLAIYVLGGTGSVTPATFNAIAATNPGGTTTRIDGSDRYVLSSNVAKKVDFHSYVDPPAVLVFNAESQGAFYDALSASAISAQQSMPMLAVRKSTVPTSVKNTLAGTFAGKPRYVVSGTGWVSSAVYSAVGASARLAASSDRNQAAGQIANYARRQGWLLYENMGIANKLPDSLTGGAYMGMNDGILLYTDATSFPSSTNSFVVSNRYGSERGFIFGGTASVSGTTGIAFGTALNTP